jgi:sugar phosphate permease
MGELVGFGLLATTILAGASVALSPVLRDLSRRQNVMGLGLIALVLVSAASVLGFGPRLAPFTVLIIISFWLNRTASRESRPGVHAQ